MVVFQMIDALTLDSIFPAPGRNDPCHCGSGVKYKRCCCDSDQEVWRTVARWSKEADAAGVMLRSIYPEFDPE